MSALTVFVVTALWTTIAHVDGQTFPVSEGQEQRKFIGNVAQSPELQESIQSLNLNLSRLQYTIFTKGNPLAKHFTIDQSTGAVFTDGPLDREQLCSPEDNPCIVQLDISAHNADGFLQILNVQVLVNDINDNDPVFPERPVRLQIPESEPVNSTFTFRGATDKDSVGPNSRITYEMISAGSPFDMTVTTYPDRTQDVGLVITRRLDRERVPSYQLQILAKDGGNPQKTGTVFVEVEITDVNDNYPVFTEEVYTVTIKEDQAVGSPVLQVLARDIDAGDNGKVTYRFSTATEAFVINATSGRVQVGENVDFEQKQVYRLMVEARDAGSVPKTKKAQVIVNVSDVNDNAPEMSFNFLPSGDHAVIPEHSELDTFVAYLSVSDKDSGNNAKVQCSIEGDRYSLGSQKLNEYIIKLRTVLDFEVQTEDYVGVVCVDSGSPAQTSSSGFNVIVQDVNDFAPVLPKSEYDITIEEGTEIGTVLLNVSATDRDMGENGRISYRIEGESSSMFSVSSTGEMWVNLRPDREAQDEVKLTLVATDHGDPAKSATALVTITITDINDESPEFGQNQYKFNVSENLEEATFVGKVNTTDRDLGLGGEVRYSLSSNYDSQFFSISADTGVITAVEALDRESRSIHELIVIAEDKGTPTQSSSVAVFVKVLDVNDNTPLITFPSSDNYSVSIPNSLEVNSEVLSVAAQDRDDGENAKLTYVLLEQEKSPEFFGINQTSGRIVLLKKIKAIISKTYKLSLAVRDQGSPQRETWRNFSVFVSVMNDTAVMSESTSGKYNLVIVLSVIALTVLLSVVILAMICVIKRRDNKQVEGDNIRPDLYDKPTNRKPEPKSANVGEIVRGEKVLEKQTTEQNIYSGSNKYDAPLKSSSPKDFQSYAAQQPLDNQALEQQHLQYIRDFFPKDTGLDMSNSVGDSSRSPRGSNWESQSKPASSLKQPKYPSDGPRRSSQRHANSSKKQNRPNRVQWALEPDHNSALWTTDCPDFHSQVLSEGGMFGGKPDDSTSDLSGDTGTSDSGRGGSDDDIHRGYCMQIDHEGVHGHYV